MIFKLYLTAWYIWALFGVALLLACLWDEIDYVQELLWFVIFSSGLSLVLGGLGWLLGLIWVN